jgi:hypothetical protein
MDIPIVIRYRIPDTSTMRALTLTLLVAALPLAAFAGTESAAAPGKEAAMPVTCPPVPLDTVVATSDYGFHQDLKDSNGAMEVVHNDFELDRRIPLNFLSWPNAQCGQWFLRLGAEYERFDFSIENETRLPDTLQSASGDIALEYRVNDKAAFLIESRPGVYFQQRVNSGAFDAPTHIAGVFPFFHSDKFYLIGGVAVSGLSRFPVIPIGGLLWHISDKWDLRAYLPNPRIVYQWSDGLELYTGAELVGGAYRADNRDVTPVKLSGARVTYDEVRTGAGITWTVKPLKFDFAAGYTVQSEFDYSRAGTSIYSHPAPYIRLTARLDF